MEGSQYLGGEGAQNLMGIGLSLVQSLCIFLYNIYISAWAVMEKLQQTYQLVLAVYHAQFTTRLLKGTR
jgi:hypothetical protein